jgi:hypothetical protein
LDTSRRQAAARAAQLSGLAVLLAARGAAGSVRLGTGAVLLTVPLLPEAGLVRARAACPISTG